MYRKEHAVRRFFSHLKTEQVSVFILALIMLVMFFHALQPLFQISRYNQMSTDDITYGLPTHEMWIKTHSIGEVLHVTISEVVRSWHEWQGTYAAIFLFTLQPEIFATRAYMLTGYLLLGTYLVCTGLFLSVLFSRVFRLPRAALFITVAGTLFFAVQTVPAASDSFFWFNGGVFYTFFHSLSLLLISGVVLLPDIKQRGARAAGGALPSSPCSPPAATTLPALKHR